MNNKNSKRALLTSVLSLAVCGSMLVGTTFAWFTDSVSSGSNVITTGNLDVEVEYTLDGEEWKKLDKADDLFQKGLWEPGHTEVVALRISNEGSLALKYSVNLDLVNETAGTNVYGDEFKLSDLLEVSTLTQQANDPDGWGDVALGLAFNGEKSVRYEDTNSFADSKVLKENQELFSGDAHYMIVKVDMPETIGNEANYKTSDDAQDPDKYRPSIEFGLNVVAAQAVSEYDSFGNDYDKDATYPRPITSVKELKNAVAVGGHYQLAADIEFSKEDGVLTVKSEVVIDLDGYTIDASENTTRPFEIVDGASLTINAEDEKIVCGKYGLVNMTEGTLTINGGTFINEEGNNGAFIKVDGEKEMEINLNNVTYKAGTADSGVLRTAGSNVTLNINGGTYEAGMGFITTKGTIQNAEITATNTANMWPAVYAAGSDVTIKGCTIKSACHAIAVAGGETVTVENCDVVVPADCLAFQVFSSGGTINVFNSTYTGKYGTTGKMDAGCVAIINIDSEEVFRKTSV